MSTMQGQACHSSTPESGINAITLSMKMVCEIERLNSEYRDSASLCVTVANGGSVATPNVVPDSCSIKFSVRTSDSMTLSKIKFELKQKHDEISLESKTQLVNIFDIPPFEKRDNPYVKHLAEINNIAITEQKFTTEAGVIQQAFPKSDIVIFGPGDPNCAHKPEEEININELKKYSKDLVEIIAGYSAFKEKNLDEKELQL